MPDFEARMLIAHVESHISFTRTARQFRMLMSHVESHMLMSHVIVALISRVIPNVNFSGEIAFLADPHLDQRLGFVTRNMHQ